MAVATEVGAARRGMSRRGEEGHLRLLARHRLRMVRFLSLRLAGGASSARTSSAQYPEATRNIFALLAFAAGFLVRPFGALVFGRIGDLVGRKYTFLVTILIMGLSTFLVGLLPGSASIGIAAPVILIALRMLQGLALGGEYGGAATYVAEHAPDDRRGYYTSWIQTTATLGLFLSLIVILIVQGSMSKEAFAAWGWRIPFLLSFILLGISVWIRLSLSESPTFQRMKDEGKGSKAPLTRSLRPVEERQDRAAGAARPHRRPGRGLVFRPVLRAVLPAERAEGRRAVGQHHDRHRAGARHASSSSCSAGCPTRSAASRSSWRACALAIVTYFPLFKALTWAANPALATAQQNVRATVTAAPGDCKFQFNPVGTAKFTTSCDIATSFLTKNSVPYDVVATAAPGTAATVKIGERDGRIAMTRSPPATRPRPRTRRSSRPSTSRCRTAAIRWCAIRPRSPTRSSTRSSPANPKLALDAAAIRAGDEGDGAGRPGDQGQAVSRPRKRPVRPTVTVYTAVPGAADVCRPGQVNWPMVIAILFVW